MNPVFCLSPERWRKEIAAGHSGGSQHDGRHMTHASPQAFKDATPALADLKPRVRVAVVVELSGLDRRTVTDHAKKKKIPGAEKHGGVWTFDQDLLALWLKKGNKWHETSTPPATARITTSASPSTAKNTESRFARLLSGLPKNGRGRVSKS